MPCFIDTLLVKCIPVVRSMEYFQFHDRGTDNRSTLYFKIVSVVHNWIIFFHAGIRPSFLQPRVPRGVHAAQVVMRVGRGHEGPHLKEKGIELVINLSSTQLNIRM